MALKPAQSELERKLQERLQCQPAADWVRDMIEHYRRTGSYRPEDLRRLLGDPTKGVDMGADASLASFLADRESKAS